MPGLLPRQPPVHLDHRLRAIRTRIQRKALDGYLVTSPLDQFYLTGFDGEDGAALILLNKVYLITDGRFEESAERIAPWAQVFVRKCPLIKALSRIARRLRLKRIGFDPATMTVQNLLAFRQAIAPARLVSLPGPVGDLRLLKDATEVAAIEKAIQVAEEGFKRVIRRLRVGMTEREIAADLHHEMVRLGASDASFPIIVAEGANSSLPHAMPGNRQIHSGSAILLDWGATVSHYRSDLTRMVFVHRIPPRFLRMYRGVLAAQMEAIQAIRPNVRMCDVDRRARQCLRQARLDRYFTHGTGHGLGLEIHEAPRLARRIQDELRPGMVVTVEPGVYFPGVGGVRIEDDVLVTETGCRVLTTLAKDLDSMVV